MMPFQVYPYCEFQYIFFGFSRGVTYAQKFKKLINSLFSEEDLQIIFNDFSLLSLLELNPCSLMKKAIKSECIC